MIKEKRKEKNYTQEKMSELLGISLRQYVRIDNEEDLPRRDILKALINELDLSNEEIGIYIRNMTENIAWISSGFFNYIYFFKKSWKMYFFKIFYLY